MEQTNIKTEAQEQQPPEDPTTLRAWVTPAFEKVALNEALLGPNPTGKDFYSSS
jgi:hypothetical protein